MPFFLHDYPEYHGVLSNRLLGWRGAHSDSFLCVTGFDHQRRVYRIRRGLSPWTISFRCSFAVSMYMLWLFILKLRLYLVWRGFNIIDISIRAGAKASRTHPSLNCSLLDGRPAYVLKWKIELFVVMKEKFTSPIKYLPISALIATIIYSIHLCSSPENWTISCCYRIPFDVVRMAAYRYLSISNLVMFCQFLCRQVDGNYCQAKMLPDSIHCTQQANFELYVLLCI